MKEDTIYTGSNNKVRYLFNHKKPWDSLGLQAYAWVELTLGDETYSTLDNPELLYIEDYVDPLGRVWNNAILCLSVGSVTTLYPGEYDPRIEGFIDGSSEGRVLTHSDFRLLPTKVK